MSDITICPTQELLSDTLNPHQYGIAPSGVGMRKVNLPLRSLYWMTHCKTGNHGVKQARISSLYHVMWVWVMAFVTWHLLVSLLLPPLKKCFLREEKENPQYTILYYIISRYGSIVNRKWPSFIHPTEQHCSSFSCHLMDAKLIFCSILAQNWSTNSTSENMFWVV